jgi:NAD-dependent dihydropyrimidine dehydrogenase PreA subunit
MIFYFSGTGNSKWVAEVIAKKINDQAECIIDYETPVMIKDKIVGIVFPIYAWGAPEVVLNFVKEIKGNPSFSFAIGTCGGEAGYALDKLDEIFPLDSIYTVVMPSNYIMGAAVEDEDSVRSKITNAKNKLEVISSQIRSKEKVKDVIIGSMPWIKSNLFNVGFNSLGRRTKPFYATEKCISCGQCEKNCPAKTIKLVDGKPQWGQECYQCTACINLCPVGAIEYGKSTSSRGRYKFRDIDNRNL